MTLRLKLILSFLLAGLLTTAAVGVTAWWMVMQDFQQSVEDQAFTHFQQDIVAYIKRYGSWEAANQAQNFTHFVMQRRRPPPLPSQSAPLKPDTLPMHRPLPPFRFLLLSADGTVLRGLDQYQPGQSVPESVLEQGKAIVIDDQVQMLAVPIGKAMLSPQDEIYLKFLQHALVNGMAAAAILAILLGLLFGRRLVRSLEELIHGLNHMRPDGEIPEPVPVRSRDEIGLLAETFNRMSRLLMDAHRELRELSIRDPLTSLYNRRYFDEQAKSMFKHALRYQSPLCVILIDLDHFKLINDSFSHSVGDKVLQRAAKLLETNIRESDLLARYGGEEFIAIFAESSLIQSRQRCELLRKRIEAEAWDEIAPGLKVTASLGLCDNTDLGSLEAMINAADEYLYLAKDNGRNRLEPAA